MFASAGTKPKSVLRTRQAKSALSGGSNTWTADQYFKSGRPCADVRGYGATGTGLSDDSAAIQSAITVIQLLGGGTVFFPPGSYRADTTVTVNSSSAVRLLGGSLLSSLLFTNSDIKLLSIQGAGRHSVENLQILGNGIQGGNGTATSATSHALHLASTCVDVLLHRLYIAGGYIGVLNDGTDTVMDNVIVISSYGTALVKHTGIAPWMRRCKIDNPWPVSVPAVGASTAARANTTAYVAGDVRSLAGYYIQCLTPGTSAGAPPSLQNFNANITDGTVVWRLACNTGSSALELTTGASEVHAAQCDFTGAQGRAGISINNDGAGTAPFIIVITDCVVSQSIGSSIDVIAGTSLQLCGNEIASPLGTGNSGVALRSAWAGDASIVNNLLFGASTTIGIYVGSGINHTVTGNNIFGWQSGVIVEANVSKFAIVSNNLGTSTKWGTNTTGIAITAGTSDNYTILANLLTGAGTKITDGGTGTNKIVQDTESTFSSGLRSTGTAGVGYATGAGGTVTQATSKATAVTLNKTTGTIALNAAALAGDTTVSFVFNNSTMTATDQLLVTHDRAGSPGSYLLNGRATGAGTAEINVRKNTTFSIS